MDKMGITLRGVVVNVGNPTKTNGRFVTFSTGSNLVAVFYPQDKQGQIPELMKGSEIKLDIGNKGFIQVTQ